MKKLDQESLVRLMEKNPELTEVLPWSEMLIKYHNGINEGCSCNKTKRAKAAENLYVDIVTNFVSPNNDVKDYLKDFFTGDKILFTKGDEILLTIE